MVSPGRSDEAAKMMFARQGTKEEEGVDADADADDLTRGAAEIGEGRILVEERVNNCLNVQ